MDSHFQKCELLAEEGEHIVTSAFVTKARVLRPEDNWDIFINLSYLGSKMQTVEFLIGSLDVETQMFGLAEMRT